MKVGYIEFNHRAYKFVSTHKGSQHPEFFCKVSETLKKNASNTFCDGFTNYQFPLEQVSVSFIISTWQITSADIQGGSPRCRQLKNLNTFFDLAKDNNSNNKGLKCNVCRIKARETQLNLPTPGGEVTFCFSRTVYQLAQLQKMTQTSCPFGEWLKYVLCRAPSDNDEDL